jgi:hypothetical protein
MISIPVADDCTSTSEKPKVSAPSLPCTWSIRRCYSWYRNWPAATGSVNAGRCER